MGQTNIFPNGLAVEEIGLKVHLLPSNVIAIYAGSVDLGRSVIDVVITSLKNNDLISSLNTALVSNGPFTGKIDLQLIFAFFKNGKPPPLKRYARRRIIIYAGLSLKRLQYLQRNHLVDLLRVMTEQDVDQILVQTLSRIKTP